MKSVICGIDFHRGTNAPSTFHRGAMIDGSRGFQPTGAFQPTGINAPNSPRRGATVDAMASCGVARGFLRRAATPIIFGTMIRGLKPTATITMSLRDEDAMPMAAVERAMRIQKNMEGFGV